MSKRLVAYFSASGVTRSAAEKIAKTAEADIFEIKPAVPYSSADLNWQNPASRSSVEMHDASSRPATCSNNAKIADYDVIFVGFPIWWYIAPTIINTFLEQYDFSGKRIILFATSGGSGFGEAASFLRPSVGSSASIEEGKMIKGQTSIDEIANWIKSLNL